MPRSRFTCRGPGAGAVHLLRAARRDRVVGGRRRETDRKDALENAVHGGLRTYDLPDLVRTLGYTDEDRAGAGVGNTFYLLTDQRFILGSRASTRNRPKTLVHSASRSAVRLHWFDDPEGSNQSRNFIVEFGDGTYRSDKMGITLLGRPQEDAERESRTLIDEKC